MIGHLLAAIADPARPRITARVAVVVAHPDDETLGCGALLPRLHDVRIVHVTDGAPRSADDARRHDFDSTGDYAKARAAELAAALAVAGVPNGCSTALGIADQGVAFALAEIVRRLVPMLSGVEFVLTHSYEGGHPDHDATAFGVRAACEMIGVNAPAIVEMPFYRTGPDGSWLRQSFAPTDDVTSVTLVLTEAERELKALMLAAHATQAETLRGFGVADESYRVAPNCDFANLPNGGDLLYERYGWGLTGSLWLDLAADARQQLGLGQGA